MSNPITEAILKKREQIDGLISDQARAEMIAALQRKDWETFFAYYQCLEAAYFLTRDIRLLYYVDRLTEKPKNPLLEGVRRMIDGQ